MNQENPMRVISVDGGKLDPNGTAKSQVPAMSVECFTANPDDLLVALTNVAHSREMLALKDVDSFLRVNYINQDCEKTAVMRVAGEGVHPASGILTIVDYIRSKFTAKFLVDENGLLKEIPQ